MPRISPIKRSMLEFLAENRDDLKAESTVESYEKILLKKVLPLAKKNRWPAPLKLEQKHLREFWESINHQATTSQANYLMVFILWVRWTGNKNKMRRPRLSVRSTRIDWRTPEEVALLIGMADRVQLQGALVLMSYTGLRVGECISASVKDIRENSLDVVMGKGRKDRTIPLDQEFWDAFRPYWEWRKTQRWENLLIHERGPYLSTQAVTQMIRRHAQKFNLHVSSHTLRRSFGRHLYLAGCPLVQIKELLGHASLETTIRYLGINQYDLESAITFRVNYRKLYLDEVSQQ